ncbi:MAG: TonB-dependent receptor domain-containing protein, partial [Lachnospirales bacterium]
LLTRLVYNYNDFKFDKGFYKGNQIAGIPKQTIFLELEYKLAESFIVAPNLKIQPDDNWADHLNTIKQDSFHLWGLKLAYNPKPNLNLYMNFNNLADKVYSSTYAIRAESTADLPTFLPGDGFNYSFGIKYTF